MFNVSAISTGKKREVSANTWNIARYCYYVFVWTEALTAAVVHSMV